MDPKKSGFSKMRFFDKLASVTPFFSCFFSLLLEVGERRRCEGLEKVVWFFFKTFKTLQGSRTTTYAQNFLKIQTHKKIKS